MTAFNKVFTELAVFSLPLQQATFSGEQLSVYLSRFGIALDAAGWNAAMNDLANLSTTVEEFQDLIIDALDQAGDLQSITPADVAALVAKATELYDGIDDLVDVLSGLAGINDLPRLLTEVMDLLLDDYLALRLPPVRELSSALALRVERQIAPGDPGGRDRTYTQVQFDWSRLNQFITDTGNWAEDVYGWGDDFQHIKALVALTDLVGAFGGRSRFEEIDPAILSSFLTNVPTQQNGVSVSPAMQVRLPLLNTVVEIDDAGVEAGADSEAGLTVLPVGDWLRGDQIGLALAPYAMGTVSAETQLGDNLTFRFAASAEATGGRFITFRPSGIDVVGGGAVAAEFDATLAYQSADGSPVILVGKADGSRIEAAKLLAATGGSMDGDIYVAGGVEGLHVSLDMGEDGLLGSIVPDPVTVEAGDILMGIRPGRGVYFEGGTELAIDIPLDIDLNVIRFLSLGVRLDWSENFAVEVTTEAELSIGPLFAYADGIGVRAEIADRPGLLGQKDLDFSFVPPAEYAVSLDLPPIEGGGYLGRDGDQFRGALSLKFEAIGFSAFALLDTRLPGGQQGYSLAASVFGEFNLPLAYGFFLTGLGGIIGINRTFDTTAMRDVLYQGNLDNLLFPADPIANAANILDDMAAVLPPRQGQHVVGPVARIGWGQPILINVTLGLVLEVGDETRLSILGSAVSVLPDESVALVDLRLAFFGSIDFSARTIAFDASLQDSRVLTYTLSGDVALRSGWAAAIEHVISFGGLHPEFPRPANLPELRRITIAFGTNNPRVTLSGYTALTLNTLQFGASAELYARGPDLWIIGQLAAEGSVYFNALVTFNPFGFVIGLGGGLSLLRNGNVACGLGFDLTIKGPNRFEIDGRVWVTFMGKDIDFRIEHEWGSRQSLPTTQVDAVEVLHAALQKAALEPSGTSARANPVVFRMPATDEAASVDPYGGAALDQSAVPLGISIDKIGEAQLSGANTLDIRVTRGSSSVTPEGDRETDFVHGHFFTLTRGEKLRATTFDRLKSGYVLAGDGVEQDVQGAVHADYDYERIIIPVAGDDTGTGTLVGQPHIRDRSAALIDRVFVAEMAETPALADRIYNSWSPADQVATTDLVFESGADGLGGPVPLPDRAPGSFGSFAEAQVDGGLATLLRAADTQGSSLADFAVNPVAPAYLSELAS